MLRSDSVPNLGHSIVRGHLLEIVAETHPRLIYLVAPAGYGKTILASQLAASSRFKAAVWLDADGQEVTSRSLATALLPRDGKGHRPSEPTGLMPSEIPDCPEDAALKSACAGLLGRPTCVVLDNAVLDAQALDLRRFWALIAEVIEADVCVVVTTRALAESEILDGHALVLQPEDLRFTSEEAATYLQEFCTMSSGEDILETCLAMSGGHPALFAVLARTGRIRRDRRRLSDGQLSRQLEFLAATQLTPRQHELLVAASLLRRGGRTDLETVLDSAVTDGDLERIADCIPLFRLSSRNETSYEFRIHDIGRDVFSRHACRTEGSPLVGRVIGHLARFDRCVEAFELVAQVCGPEEAAGYLQEYGERLLEMGPIRLMQSILERLPPSLLVHRPALLLLSARALRLLGDEQEAARRTRLAAELAGQSGDQVVRVEALVLLGRSQICRGHAREAAGIFEAVLSETNGKLATERLGLVYAHLAMALVHTGDVAESQRYLALSEQTRRSCSSSTAARYCELIHAYCVALGPGENGSAVAVSARACRAGTPVEVRIPSMLNTALCIAMEGRLERAEAVLTDAERVVSSCGADVGQSGCLSTRAVIEAGKGNYEEAEALMSSIRETAVDDYDLHSSLLYRSWWRRASGDPEGGLADSEQAKEFFLEFEHMPLLWEASVESCANLLVLGDVAAVQRVAIDLSSRLSGALAHGLALRARLVAAECLARGGMTDSAIAALRPCTEYVLSGNGNWHAAMYIRAFPNLLGLIVAAVGAALVPAHLLRMIPPDVADQALGKSCAILPEPEYALLCDRLGVRRPYDLAEHLAPHCTVRLFGGLSVVTSDGAVADADWRKRKARLLFVMLVVRKGKDVPREQLLDYLWPEMDGDRARANFYVIWNNMKRALSPSLEKGKPSPFVRASGGVCRVDDARVSTDLDDFERCLQDARRAEGDGECEEALTAYRRLAEIYRGDLLPGDIYDDWFGPLRERCRQEFGDAMSCASGLLAANGDHVGALQLLRQALTFDPWREDLYQAALRCQIAAGQRSAAIDTYMTCMHKLSEDLGLDPSAETKRLYDQVLAMEDPPRQGYAV